MPRAARRGPLLTLLWRSHRFWYRLTGGRIGTRLAGWDVLLLTTRGRQSGERRSVTLNYLREGSALVVIASNVGDDRDPLWAQSQSEPGRRGPNGHDALQGARPRGAGHRA